MEAVIFVGLQGAGKTTFYRDRFFATHLRLNLDMLKTRHREGRLIQVCVETGLRFVVDNTNPTRAERRVYIRAAQEVGFRVIGYYFRSHVEDCMRRNQGRPEAQRVPFKGLLGTAGRMERPTYEEGFDELHYVRTDEGGGFAYSNLIRRGGYSLRARAPSVAPGGSLLRSCRNRWRPVRPGR